MGIFDSAIKAVTSAVHSVQQAMGPNVVHGTDQGEVVLGSPGVDELHGHGGNDTIFDNKAFSATQADNSDDTLIGGPGDDGLVATGGHDTLRGGSGNDVLIGGANGDHLTGGSGADIFRYMSFTDSTPQDRDNITDFSHAAGDKIDLHFVSEDYHFTDGPSAAQGAVWASGSGQDWTVHVNKDGPYGEMAIDVHLAQGTTHLTASDFIF